MAPPSEHSLDVMECHALAHEVESTHLLPPSTLTELSHETMSYVKAGCGEVIPRSRKKKTVLTLALHNFS
jgi:hypothetical protein